MPTRPLKVLAIDDNQDNLTTLRAVLEDAMPGCELVLTVDGSSGLALAASEDPDVILLDIAMPGMDGFEVCRRLKADAALRIIPVVFLTALRTDRASRLRALEVGAEAFLAKPVDEQELVAQLRAMGKIRKAARQSLLDKEQLEALVRERTIALEHELAERSRVEAALRESEARSRAIAQTAYDAIITTDSHGVIVSWNQGAARVFGYEESEFLGQNLSLLIPPEHHAAHEAAMARLATGELRKNLATSVERTGIRKDGTHFPLELSVAMWEASGTRYFTSILRDISARKRSELEREVLADIARGVSTSADLDALLAFVHQALQRVFDANNCFVALHDDRTGLFSFPFFVDQHDEPPPPTAMPTSCTAYVFRHGTPTLITPPVFRQLQAQGEVSLVGSPSPSWMGTPLRTPSGMIGVLVLQHYERENAYTPSDLDFLASVGSQVALVIERTLAHVALRSSEAELNLILESSADGLLAVDAAGKVVRTNQRFAEMWRIPREIIDSRDDNAMLTHVLDQLADSERFVAQVRALYNSTDQSHDTLLFRDGRVFDRHSAPIMQDGAIAGRLWTFDDITERRRTDEAKAALEAQLHHAQKMESVGRLAGGIAHDFNNMLGAILGTVEVAIEQVEKSHPLHDDLQEIRRAAQRSTDLTRQLLAFARRQTVAPQVLDLNETVRGLLGMMQRLIGEDISISWHPSANVWPVSMDPSQLANVLTNLCVNARHAIADVGEISLETANVEIDPAFCESHPDAVPGDFVRLMVRDTGCGMDATTLALVFEPFFTTRDVGEGTGLGLASVYGAVRQNDGFVTVKSTVGVGTTFAIYLPRRAAEPKAARASGAMPAIVAAGQETVLLVEDEPSILRLATRVLKSRGYAVLAASDPLDALRQATEHDGDIHLLLTDVVMPRMNGRDLAQRVMELRPEIRRLFMSGHTADVIATRGMLEPGTYFLEKPFSTDTLLSKVREVLDEA